MSGTTLLSPNHNHTKIMSIIADESTIHAAISSTAVRAIRRLNEARKVAEQAIEKAREQGYVIPEEDAGGPVPLIRRLESLAFIANQKHYAEMSQRAQENINSVIAGTQPTQPTDGKPNTRVGRMLHKLAQKLG